METGAISTAQIDVFVTDTDATPLPGASGTLVGETDSPREAVSDTDGGMQFRMLPPGFYALTIRLEGFEDFRVAQIHLEVGQTEKVDAMMSPQG